MILIWHRHKQGYAILITNVPRQIFWRQIAD
jgi:hypothetical protein